MTKEQWAQISSGEVVEVTEEDFDYFLDCLPPKFIGRSVRLMNGDVVHAAYGFCEGADRVIAFWRTSVGTGIATSNEKYYAAGTLLFSRGG